MSESRHTVKFTRTGFAADRDVSPIGQPQRVEYDEGGGKIRIRWTADSLSGVDASVNWTILLHTAGAGSVAVPAGARRVAVEAVSLGTPAPTATIVYVGHEGAEMARRYGPGRNQLPVDNADFGFPSATPVNHYDFTDMSQLYSDAGLTTLLPNDEGAVINGITDKGSFNAHMDANFGNATGPTLRKNLLGGLSGARFVRASSTIGNGLRTKLDTFDYTTTMTWVMIGVNEAPTIATGAMFRGPVANDNLGEMEVRNTSLLHTEVSDGKAQQNGAFVLNEPYAGWVRHVPSTMSTSLSVVSGTASYGIIGPTITNTRIALGTVLAGTGTFGEFSCFEFILWDATIPTAQEIEDYVSARYGIGWTA